MKARFASRKWPPAVGGMETYSVRMVDELASRCDLECVTLPGRNDGRAPSGLALVAFGISSALRTPFRRKVDVAHLGDVALWPIGFIELFFGRANRLILSAHGSDVSLILREGLLARTYRIYLKVGASLLSNARIIANSSYIADLARSVGFTDVRVVALGTDMVAESSPEREGLLFVGRITRSKGLRFLVEEVLPLLNSDITLSVAGTLWEERERHLLLNPRVNYLGALDPNELQFEYSRAKVTLVPSRIPEGFGLVATEAAACGSQVIASDCGGLREVVKEPWGELVDPSDPAKWAQAIERRMCLGPSEVESLKQAAIKDIDQDFRWKITADRTMTHYRL